MEIKDNILKRLLSQKGPARSKGKCPDEQALAAFSEGKLDEPQATKVLEHLLSCENCLDQVRIQARLTGEENKIKDVLVPEKLKKRALRLDPAGRPAGDRLLDVVVSFTRDMVDVIRGTSEVAPGALVPEPIRSGHQVLSETLVTFTKEFPPYQAEVEVEKIRPDRGEITIKLVKSGSPEPPTGIRVSLFSNQRELESSVIEGGLAVFQNVRFGKYKLNITETGKEIGRISLNMKGEGTQ